MNHEIYHCRGKRTLDVVVSGFLLVVFLPVLVITALLVFVTLGRPVLFRQPRPGLRGRPFTIMKFRTMTAIPDGSCSAVSDEERLSRMGGRLRRWSLDELPTLWNVLLGEMSLVGPRPLLMQYLERYTAEQARRHEVKPGITGWAQVNGRNALTWEEKFSLDAWYVDHYSFLLDLRILGMTVKKVFSREGISAGGHATMPEFEGSRKL